MATSSFYRRLEVVKLAATKTNLFYNYSSLTHHNIFSGINHIMYSYTISLCNE
jgi:hypothetical protein